MPVELFFEMGIVLIIAAACSMLMFGFRQPLIIAYLLTGIVVGPGVLALTVNPQLFEILSQLGVAFLLFTIGLGLNWRTIKDVGGIALATGVGQVLFSVVFGWLIGTFLGFDALTSLYLAIAFAFSSTIIIVKLLMDKEDLDTLYGRITVGLLLVQDFIAMLLLLLLGAIGRGASLEQLFVYSLVKGLLIVPFIWFISAKLLPRALHYVAQSQELLFVFSVAWCFLVSGLLYLLGFGIEVGALIAGISLSGSLYQREMNARIHSVRDFFLIIFFIVLGTRLDLLHLSNLIAPIIVFSFLIIFAKPFVVMCITRLLGYHPRTGFFSGTSTAQVSEFSFIVLASGISLGHLSNETLSLATATAIITIAVSTYFVEHNERLYALFHPFFRWFEPAFTLKAERLKQHQATKVVLFGYHRTGAMLLTTIRKLKQSYTIVDFDPHVIRELAALGEPAVYGDAGDEVFLEELKVNQARLIISTIPDFAISSALLTFLKARRFSGVVIVSVHTENDAQECDALGATYVIIPSVLSGKKFSELLDEGRTRKGAWKKVKMHRYDS